MARNLRTLVFVVALIVFMLVLEINRKSRKGGQKQEEVLRDVIGDRLQEDQGLVHEFDIGDETAEVESPNEAADDYEPEQDDVDDDEYLNEVQADEKGNKPAEYNEEEEEDYDQNKEGMDVKQLTSEASTAVSEPLTTQLPLIDIEQQQQNIDIVEEEKQLQEEVETDIVEEDAAQNIDVKKQEMEVVQMEQKTEDEYTDYAEQADEGDKGRQEKSEVKFESEHKDAQLENIDSSILNKPQSSHPFVFREEKVAELPQTGPREVRLPSSKVSSPTKAGSALPKAGSSLPKGGSSPPKDTPAPPKITQPQQKSAPAPQKNTPAPQKSAPAPVKGALSAPKISPLISTGGSSLSKTGSTQPKAAPVPPKPQSPAQSGSTSSKAPPKPPPPPAPKKPGTDSCKYDHIVFQHDDTEGSMQQAGPNTHVYSAYYDARDQYTEPVVRVIGLSDESAIIYCHLWYTDKDSNPQVQTVQAEVSVPIIHLGVPLETVFIMCPVEANAGAPSWVVLSDTLCGPPKAILKVSNIHGRKIESNFAVCIHGALVGDYYRKEHLVEFMEINKIFGAEKFVMYNYSGHEELLPYINYYTREGMLEFRKWPVHHIENKISYRKAQSAVTFDCVYRYMYRTKYLVLVNLNQILVPMQHDTWAEMLEASGCKNEMGINFKHLFMKLRYEVNPNYEKIASNSPLELMTLEYTKTQDVVWPCELKSKYMIRPEHAVAPGWTSGNTKDNCCLPQSLALLMHYTKTLYYEDEEMINYLRKVDKYDSFLKKRVDVDRMYDFADKLIDNVVLVYNRVNAQAAT